MAFKVGHGTVEGDVYWKRVKGSVHFLRKPPSIAMDCADIRQAQDAGAAFVCITDVESGMQYWASIRQVLVFGIGVERGHGLQLALTFAHWKRTRAEAEKRTDRPGYDARLC